MYHNMIRTQTLPNSILRLLAACLVCLAVTPVLFSGKAGAKGTLPPEVQKALTELLAMQTPSAPLPDSATLGAFLEYTTSPVNLTGVGEAPPYPEKYQKGTGILWRSKLRGVPLATTIEYLFNPKVPMTVVYPASIRYSTWQAGSDILTAAPLQGQLGKHKDTPLVLRGTEFEEITPDDNTGTSYSYMLDRVVILTEYEGRQVVLSFSWQKGKSDTGKKAATIGDYSNWDFVYSGVQGTLASGIGWAETYIYSSAAISIFYEDEPGGKDTGYALYRWMNAGWSGMNMVKQSHIIAGAVRSFTGLKTFLEAPERPTPAAIEAFMAELNRQDLPALQARFAPYSAKVEEAAATVEALKTEDFQKVIRDGGYGKSMTKDEIIAAFAVNYIKEKMGKPLLAGRLAPVPANGK